jgi:hypothetical protein
MNNLFIRNHRLQWPAILSLFVLAGLLSLPACTSKPVLTPTSGSSLDIRSMAEDIATDAGQVMQTVGKDPNRVVVIFEEIHDSPAGQVEIAIMLNRLYLQYGLRQIGLEGAFFPKGNLDASWFSPSFGAGQMIGERQDVAVQTLESGEINSAELMALIYPDIIVTGIDDKDLYGVEPEDAAWNAPIFYLMQIAATSMNDEEITNANEMITEAGDLNNEADELRAQGKTQEADKKTQEAVDKYQEAIDYVINTDEWASKKYELYTDEAAIPSCKDELQLLNDIEAKAEEVSASIEAGDKDSMQSLREFYDATCQRDSAMTGHILELLKQNPGIPVAITIGAAHTEGMTRIFSDNGVSFVVIRATSFNVHNGDLNNSPYTRKMDVKSVDSPGELGFMLDGRKKPQSVIETVWFKSKAGIFLLANRLAHALATGQPFSEALDGLSLPDGVNIDQSTIEVKDGSVLFMVGAQEENGKHINIWVRTKKIGAAQAKTLEQRLFESRDRIRSMPEPDPNYVEPTESDPTETLITSDVKAIFATSRAGILAATATGDW